MNNQSKWVPVAVLASLFLAGASAFAGPGKEGKEHGGAGKEHPRAAAAGERMGKLQELGKELNLTDDQKKQIKEATAPYRDTMRSQVKAVADKRLALRDAVTSDGANESAIRAAATELGKAAGDAGVTGSKIYAGIKAVLTPEQVKKLEEYRKENREALEKFIDASGND